MDGFSDAVKDGEVLSLNAKLASVNDCVDKLKALEAPEALKDVHDSYVKGAEELQTALKQYVALYEDVKLPEGGTFDFATYGDRLAEIQKHYSDGVVALEEGDAKATEA